MNVNADFSVRAAVRGASNWSPSPAAGVDRRMLDRIGGEVARATSIVRYAPGSTFAPHVHGGGEEFLVLDGVFQDDRGDYPAGTYVRNPPQTRHTPGSRAGCTIFVKLWQFDPADRRPIVADTSISAFAPNPERPGVEMLPLFRDRVEDVRLEHWAPNAQIDLALPGGGEFLVLSGSFHEADLFRQIDWLRLPPGSAMTAKAGPDGAAVWVKTGHLHAVQGPTTASIGG